MAASVKGTLKPTGSIDLEEMVRDLALLIADHADAAERDRRVPKAVIGTRVYEGMRSTS